MSTRLLRSLLIVVVFAIGVVTARSADAWTRIETENFEFVGDADEASIRSVADRLERFRRALGRVMSDSRTATKTRVIVFKDAATFSQFKPRRGDGAADDKVAGLFVPGDDLSVIAISADGDLSTIYHEYVHEAISKNYGREQVPPWLNEGLAEFFETIRFETDGSVTFGVARPEYLKILRERPLVPWNEFFALDNFTLHAGGDASRETFYAQAWAVTAYLIVRDRELPPDHYYTKGTITPFRLKKLAGETEHAAIEKGAREVIAGTLSPVRNIPLPGAPPLYRVDTTSFSEASANAALGDLLFRLRIDSAETYLRKAIDLDPKNASTYATLGLLRLRERKFAESRALIDKAVALDSTNYLAHYHRAFLAVQENMDEAGFVRTINPDVLAKIRESLVRSIELKGRFAESRRLLAFVELAVGGDLATAEKEAKAAAALQPGNQEHALLLAQVYARQERFAFSDLIANRLLTAPTNSRIKAEARELLRTSGEFYRARREATEPARLQIAGTKKPLILQYRDLTPEQLAKIDAERENYNYNVIIERPSDGELHVLGAIDRISCDDGQIYFRIKAASGPLRLHARKFDDLRFRVAVPGTKSFAFRCDTRMPDDNALIIYAEASRRGVDGEIKAITFVPKDFVYRTRDELLATPFVIVEGRPGADLSLNAKEAAVARDAMEREIRETQIRDIEERLRTPLTGESRVIGVPANLACQNGRMNVSVKIGDETKQFSAAIAKPFEVESYNSAAAIVEIGCRAQLPAVPAVITHRDGELIALEFVPSYFKLR